MYSTFDTSSVRGWHGRGTLQRVWTTSTGTMMFLELFLKFCADIVSYDVAVPPTLKRPSRPPCLTRTTTPRAPGSIQVCAINPAICMRQPDDQSHFGKHACPFTTCSTRAPSRALPSTSQQNRRREQSRLSFYVPVRLKVGEGDSR